ncbi:seryl-tRNA synthetase [Babesia microti strain RI]|uniref:serine--tRNA ligase n=1 Tax=Babesia microti (strain RI) TaxID=1133968 RepID=I7ISK9_BABMR|nr:seryl-tRNA synthetase [Babesia microti strain RI]CCF75706.1 seryl-tRNA synthetase [Babesia microti strain RI]|eukprot:XP_012650114.1 seryl-tRNA synthetase [Babesia microti strain RI]
MVLDINIFRCPEGLNAIKNSEYARGRDDTNVRLVVEADIEWRKADFDLSQLKKDVNSLNKQIAILKKQNAPESEISPLIANCETKRNAIISLTTNEHNTKKLRDNILQKIGNIICKTVPIGTDESKNSVIRTWFPNGDPTTKTNTRILQHHEILKKLDSLDLKKGAEIAGHRGYFLKGFGCLLNNALISYGLSFLSKKGYIPIRTPVLMKKTIMAECAELSDFAETLYCIPSNHDGNVENDERENLYLIATSEQPLTALHRNETLNGKKLPLKYAGISPCFRKEAGAHGIDTRGIFRVHNFDKVEQFCITSCENSEEMHQEMIKVSEEFYQSLMLPYRIVSIVASALNNAASKKYDLEVWFPGYNNYRELVSCSNCTDYQSVSVKTKYTTSQGTKKYVHMLNGTLVATQRCICAIVENFQDENGVRIPPVLVPYMGGSEYIPWQSILD